MTIKEFASHMNGNVVDFVALDVHTHEAVVGNRVGATPCTMQDHEANISWMKVEDVLHYFPRSWGVEWNRLNSTKSEIRYIQLKRIRESYTSNKIMYANRDESIKVYIDPHHYQGDNMNISIQGVQ